MKSYILLKTVCICGVILFAIPVAPISYGAEVKINQNQIPPYAKWGRLAMKETRAKYPTAEIVDYQHTGRVKTKKITTEKFKLWLIKDTKEFGVFITIKFDSNTEKIYSISFQESAR